MDDSEILEALCNLDPRNPLNPLDCYAKADRPEPRGKNCSCDNCFYGRDKLALEIIRLRGKESCLR